MASFSEGDIVLYFYCTVILFYCLKGLLSTVQKSVLSLILYPVFICAYFIICFTIGLQYIQPQSFMGVFKLIGLSFFIVFVSKFVIFLILSPFTKAKKNKDQKMGPGAIGRKMTSAFISGLEGLCVCVTLIWIVDYTDHFIEKNNMQLSQKIYQDRLYQIISPFNPIYDLKGAKRFKIIGSALTSEISQEKLLKTRIYRRFTEIPLIRRLLSDTDFQQSLEQGKLNNFLKSRELVSFLSDHEVFELLTSEEFYSACKKSLTPYSLKLIESRKGLLADLQLQKENYYKEEKGKQSKSLIQKGNMNEFISDTRIILKNGLVFEGQIVSKNNQGIYFMVEEGKILIKHHEIDQVKKI